MRHVDITKIKIPNDWLEKAKRLKDHLMKVDEKDRFSFIDDNSKLWKDLKPLLEDVSHCKCWYCERKVIRSFFHVDHYRPKKEIINDNGESELGYWWLAFDYKNFRLSCQYCNCLHLGEGKVSRGKGNKFPLCDGSIRGTPQSDINDEKPILLDPIEPADPQLLSFDVDGSVQSAFDSTNEILKLRADKSIDILDLNEKKIREARKSLLILCDRVVRRGDEAYEDFCKNSIAGREKFKAVLIEIKELIDEKAEFSAAAKSFFYGSNRDWIDKFLIKM